MISAPNKKRKQVFRKGERLSAAWCQKIENFVSSFRVVAGGQFEFDGSNAVLQCYGGGSRAFNGTAYTPAGILYEELIDPEKFWLKYDLSSGIITEEIGPPANPWGANETWRKKSDISGSAYF